MKLERFDEGLHHRHIVAYDPVHAGVFAQLCDGAHAALASVELVHIGSTAIVGLRGKPCGGDQLTAGSARRTTRLRAPGYPPPADTEEKPYVCASVVLAGRRFNVNVHICHRGDPVHADSLAFMAILDRRPDLRMKCEAAKGRAHAIDPADPQVYNRRRRRSSARSRR